MLTWIRSHLGLVAIAAVVLAVAMTSSATAALKITGKDIKNETVTSKDVKNGSLEAGDLSAVARASLQGTPGVPTPPYVGSGCTVPGIGAGTVTMQVAANGTISLICAVPAAPAQNGDLDGDGYLRSQECKDSNSAVHPGVTEVNGNFYDDDCDGTADDGTDVVDHDGDGDSIQQGDCDDTNTTVAFGNADTFGDGLDEDCDGVDG
jgi:Putative metal-binding motif